MTPSNSVIPRLRSASCTCGSVLTTSSASKNSSSITCGWTSVTCSQRVTALSVRETVASYVRPSALSNTTAATSRVHAAPVSSNARTSDLGGSRRTTETKRARSPTWPASRSRPTAVVISSADSGSSG